MMVMRWWVAGGYRRSFEDCGYALITSH